MLRTTCSAETVFPSSLCQPSNALYQLTAQLVTINPAGDRLVDASPSAYPPSETWRLSKGIPHSTAVW